MSQFNFKIKIKIDHSGVSFLFMLSLNVIIANYLPKFRFSHNTNPVDVARSQYLNTNTKIDTVFICCSQIGFQITCCPYKTID